MEQTCQLFGSDRRHLATVGIPLTCGVFDVVKAALQLSINRAPRVSRSPGAGSLSPRHRIRHRVRKEVSPP